MTITGPLVLPAGLLLVPAADLAPDLRGRLDWQEGDVALTHPRSRTPSRVVDRGTAELLEEFRHPRTIVEAVVRHARLHDLDPEITLVEAYPLLERLVAVGFLVPGGSPDASAILPALLPGSEVGGFAVSLCVQSLEDCELYQVLGAAVRAPRIDRGDRRGTAALKIERLAAPGRRGLAGGTLEREAAILTHLGGVASPRLLRLGVYGGRRFLLLEWCPGVDAAAAASELRRQGREGRAGLAALSLAVLDAYVRLHARGVLHGDVHPRNVLIGPDGAARLVDFGLAAWEGTPAALGRPGRGGVPFYYEPEYARATLAGDRVPAASPAGEQYAVAALLYLLWTGTHYRDFSLGRDEMLHQIAEEPPLRWAERHTEPWPELEAVLG
nr:hypothetical protein [Acidobacteriota bacterium]